MDQNLSAIHIRKEIAAQIGQQGKRAQDKAHEHHHHFASVEQGQMQDIFIALAELLKTSFKAALKQYQGIATGRQWGMWFKQVIGHGGNQGARQQK